MPDGAGIIDNPFRVKEKPIVIPSGKFEAPTSSEELRNFTDAYLTRPERLGRDDTAKNLGRFLIARGFISQIGVWRGSWGFAYEGRTIRIAERAMPMDYYNYYTVRLGYDAQTRAQLWPRYEEMDQYRFLHEVNHAYQESVMTEDGQNSWYDRAVRGNVDSHLARLFRFCYVMRSQHEGRGVTPWGNQQDYNAISDRTSQMATRAIEDANELVTMYLWHPQYLQTYLRYLLLQLPGYTQQNLSADRLTQLSPNEASNLENILVGYVREMKGKL